MTTLYTIDAKKGLQDPLVLTLAILIGVSAFAVDGSLAAIPAVAAAFSTDIGTAQYTVSFYLLGFALAQIPMGFMADYFGRRRLLLGFMSLFVLAGVLTSLSQSINTLLLARFLMGCCAASAGIVARATARDVTEGPETLRLMGLLIGILGITMILAPIVGGTAMTWFGWRASFATSAFLGFVGLALAAAYLPETNRSERQSTPYKTFIHSAKAFASSRSSVVGAVLVILTFAPMMSYITTSSGLLINEYGISPFIYALTFSIASAGYMLGGFGSRRFANIHDSKQLIRFVASGYLLCSVFLLGLMVVSPPLWMLLVVVFLYFACIGAMLSLATAYTLAPLPKSAGMAAAILGCFQLLAGASISLLLASLNLADINSLLLVMASFALATGAWVFFISNRLEQQ